MNIKDFKILLASLPDNGWTLTATQVADIYTLLNDIEDTMLEFIDNGERRSDSSEELGQ